MVILAHILQRHGYVTMVALLAALYLNCAADRGADTETDVLLADTGAQGDTGTQPDTTDTGPSSNSDAGECDADTTTDPNNCGQCGLVCPTGPRLTARCVTSFCVIQCEPGFTDANDDLRDGCESGCEPSDDPSEVACNGEDDDCDGLTDEDFTPSATCGVGACQTTEVCLNGQTGCTPFPPGDNDAVCDGIDSDCDNSVDEDYQPTMCGEGVCRAQSRCEHSRDLDREVACEPGEPGGDDHDCNGLDDDCDGDTDEGWVPDPDDECGVGACHTQATCQGGMVQCTPLEPGQEACDGIDNDCNDLIDDIGACAPDPDAFTECRITDRVYTIFELHDWSDRNLGDSACRDAFGSGWWWGADLGNSPVDLRRSVLNSLQSGEFLACEHTSGVTVYYFWATWSFDIDGFLATSTTLARGTTAVNSTFWNATGCPRSTSAEGCAARFCEDNVMCNMPCPNAPLLCCR